MTVKMGKPPDSLKNTFETLFYFISFSFIGPLAEADNLLKEETQDLHDRSIMSIRAQCSLTFNVPSKLRESNNSPLPENFSPVISSE